MRAILATVAVSTVVGVSASAAEEVPPTRMVAAESFAVNERPVLSTRLGARMVGLESELNERDQEIEVLEDQLQFVRRAQIAVAKRADEQSELLLAFSEADKEAAERNAAGLESWKSGYTLGGGRQMSAFLDTILPCESGSQPNPDTAVGPTDDWGRAQINRPVWKQRFESLTGAVFEESITDPVLNGFMAAHVEQEQGLNAWTCWRKR